MRALVGRSAIASTHARFSSVKTASPRILITGGLGQLGTNLAKALRSQFGKDNVVVTDVRRPPSHVYDEGQFEYLNVLDKNAMHSLVVRENISWMLHLSAIMSVLGESIPDTALDLNINGLRNALDVARDHKLRIFAPSTMAVFGPDAGKVMTKDDTILNPTTVYGITKVFLEQLGAYYFRKYGVDFRSVRYPGVISPETLPGGGTTDYAVHMYHRAVQKKSYTCPVLPNEPLPMMYIDDCVNGTVQFLSAERSHLTRCCYNVASMSFTPDDLHKSILKKMPLKMVYEEGVAQSIAHSWPDSMDDSNARRDWGWKPSFDIDRMTEAMFRDIPIYHPSVIAK